MIYEEGWMEYREFGTTHGSAAMSDRHVPCLWYGWRIKDGQFSSKHQVTSIAPTLARMLSIPIPSGATENYIEELFDER